jgi:hypothetical protein
MLLQLNEAMLFEYELEKSSESCIKIRYTHVEQSGSETANFLRFLAGNSRNTVSGIIVLDITNHRFWQNFLE